MIYLSGRARVEIKTAEHTKTNKGPTQPGLSAYRLSSNISVICLDLCGLVGLEGIKLCVCMCVKQERQRRTKQREQKVYTNIDQHGKSHCNATVGELVIMSVYWSTVTYDPYSVIVAQL